MMEYRTEQLNDSNSTDWEQLNDTATDGSFCHSLKWKTVLERTFGYAPRYFLIYRNNEPVALCPFYKTKIKCFNGVATLPNSIYDHIIVSDKQDFQLAKKIQNTIRDLLRQEKLTFAIVGLTSEMKDYFYGLPVSSPYPTGGNQVLNIQENSIDNIWNSLFSKHQRNKIRRFVKEEFTPDEINSKEDLDTFFRYYTKNMEYKNIGRKLSNEYPPDCKFEREIIKTYNREVIVVMLRRKEDVAGGALFLSFKSGRKMYLRLLWPNRDLPNTFSPAWYLCWFGVNRAHEMGFSTFCFGDTPDNPDDVNYQIKAKFGAQFQRRYATILSENKIFSLTYNLFRFAQQHKLASHM
ncbi:MAG TPA: hypothetical protein VE862_01710 [Candidatus Acidoferrum sp.]|nr:hypothetical protein [Candidatus Acidoferrum sp.]